MRRRAVGGAADVAHFYGAVPDAVRPAVDGSVCGGGGSQRVGGGHPSLLGGLPLLSGTSSTPMNDADDDQDGRRHGDDDAEDDAKIPVVVVGSTCQMHAVGHSVHETTG